MKQSIVLLCLLVGMMLSCKGNVGSESGLATLNMSSLDQIKKLTGKDLNYYKITIKKNNGEGCTEGEITRTQTNQNKIELNTGKNDSCVYDLIAEYGKDSTLVLKGTTGIGPNTDNKYPESGSTINVTVKLEDQKTGNTTQTTIANGTVTGTTKEVNINVCYNNDCDNNNTTTTTSATSITSVTSVEVDTDNECEVAAKKVLEESMKESIILDDQFIDEIVVSIKTTSNDAAKPTADKSGNTITVNNCPNKLLRNSCTRQNWRPLQKIRQRIQYRRQCYSH